MAKSKNKHNIPPNSNKIEIEQNNNDPNTIKDELQQKQQELNTAKEKIAQREKELNKKALHLEEMEIQAKNGFPKLFEEKFADVRQRLNEREQKITYEWKEIEAEKAKLHQRELTILKAEIERDKGFQDERKKLEEELSERRKKLEQEITDTRIKRFEELEEEIENERKNRAISLHSPFEEERKKIMPIENVFRLPQLIQEIKSFEFGRQRRVSFEYIMFKDFNDSKKHVDQIARILNGINCRINLIRFHPIPGTPLLGSDEATILKFQNELKKKGIVTTLRASRGEDIYAACGLLSTKESNKKL